MKVILLIAALGVAYDTQEIDLHEARNPRGGIAITAAAVAGCAALVWYLSRKV